MSVPIPARPSHDSSSLFHGSPISLKTGSFQNRFYPAGSPAHSLGPIAMPDFKLGAWDNNDAWLKPSSLSDDDLCRNYFCCGVALPDLHALVEHFEARHVEVIWPAAFPPTDDLDSPPAPPSPGAFDPDDMDISEPSPSPPPTPAPQSAFDSVRVINSCFAAAAAAASSSSNTTPPYTSSYSSLAGACGPQQTTQAAFNRYAGYADYSSALPGTAPSPTYDHKPPHPPHPQPAAPCLPPALLLSNSASPSPLTTPASSRPSTPPSVLALHPHPSSHPQHPQHPSPPRSTALTKPFRCPKPGCNKSYKQQNGLKYHLSHGQCNFAPRDPAVDALSDAERDRRLRPFVCAHADCGRRYKNMNGLRYHYTHTGEHGARGLALLAQGHHPLPETASSSSSSSASASASPSPAPPRYLPPPHPAVPLAPSPLSPFPLRAWDS